MSYIKASDILPEDLIRAIQHYVDGACLYIPRKPENRHFWGQDTGYRTELRERNQRIRADRLRGMRIAELASTYHLSEKSIRRILRTP